MDNNVIDITADEKWRTIREVMWWKAHFEELWKDCNETWLRLTCTGADLTAQEIVERGVRYLMGELPIKDVELLLETATKNGWVIKHVTTDKVSYSLTNMHLLAIEAAGGNFN